MHLEHLPSSVFKMDTFVSIHVCLNKQRNVHNLQKAPVYISQYKEEGWVICVQMDE